MPRTRQLLLAFESSIAAGTPVNDSSFILPCRWETWREVFRLSDPLSPSPGDAYLEKSADKWARNVEGWEWNEKWCDPLLGSALPSAVWASASASWRQLLRRQTPPLEHLQP